MPKFIKVFSINFLLQEPVSNIFIIEPFNKKELSVKKTEELSYLPLDMS